MYVFIKKLLLGALKLIFGFFRGIFAVVATLGLLAVILATAVAPIILMFKNNLVPASLTLSIALMTLWIVLTVSLYAKLFQWVGGLTRQDTEPQISQGGDLMIDPSAPVYEPRGLKKHSERPYTIAHVRKYGTENNYE
jgi:hypothetical protein